MNNLLLAYLLLIEPARFRKPRMKQPRQRGPRFGTCTYGVTLPLGFDS